MQLCPCLSEAMPAPDATRWCRSTLRGIGEIRGSVRSHFQCHSPSGIGIAIGPAYQESSHSNNNAARPAGATPGFDLSISWIRAWLDLYAYGCPTAGTMSSIGAIAANASPAPTTTGAASTTACPNSPNASGWRCQTDGCARGVPVTPLPPLSDALASGVIGVAQDIGCAALQLEGLGPEEHIRGTVEPYPCSKEGSGGAADSFAGRGVSPLGGYNALTTKALRKKIQPTRPILLHGFGLG